MSDPAPPVVPPRPVKAQAAAQGVSMIPDVPPRPANKRVERSLPSVNFPQSPFNEPYDNNKQLGAHLGERLTRAPSISHLPAQGEEGIEYANTTYIAPAPQSTFHADSAAEKRTIAEDLHLHAPKPTLSQAGATAQVSNVTRTPSAQAYHHDSGRNSIDGGSLVPTRSRSRQQDGRPPSTDVDSRRRSVYDDDVGHYQTGIRVPINPLLGDVQAPTPQGLSPQPTGDSVKIKGRRKSAIEDFRPPGSYGLHGHGLVADSKFEQDWYAKHPDQLAQAKEEQHGVYENIGSGRGAYAMSSDDLNKLVRSSASRDAGFGTNKNIPAYPDEQIGYMASEVYQRSQQNTPHPESLSRVQTNEPEHASPLRSNLTNFGAANVDAHETVNTQGAQDANGAVHVGQPDRHYNKVTGGQEQMNETQPSRSYASHPIPGEDHEYRVPILAMDEVAKNAGQEAEMHAAVSPKFERRSSHFDEHHDSAPLTPTSRPASRPGSIYQMHSATHSLSRLLSHQDDRAHMHTPLEDVDEYEPLFTDEDGKRPISAAERFKKRPDMQKRFPSQDIWEDTPDSAMHVATVSTPDLSEVTNERQETTTTDSTATAFEHPDAEHARKGEASEAEKKTLLPSEQRLLKSQFLPHLRDDMPTSSRPALANRFPSRDVWEDTPDSMYQTTTVSAEPEEPEEEEPEPQSNSLLPPIPRRPQKSRLGEGASTSQIEPSVAPQVPARPAKKEVHPVPEVGAPLTEPIGLSRDISPTDVKQTPPVTDRPKPQVPPRPAKKLTDPDSDALTKTTSIGSTESNSAVTERDVPRTKPQIPSRPVGGALAALKGNFMQDLNKKLGLGPKKAAEPTAAEEETGETETQPKELEPLQDARKGRARGPQRRAPAKSPATEATSFSVQTPKSLWSIDEDELVAHADYTHHHSMSTNTKSNVETAASSKPTETSPLVSSAISNTASYVPSDIKSSTTSTGAPLHTESKAESMISNRPDDAPAPMAAGLVRNTAGEYVDPAPEGATKDTDENTEGDLTRKTTASSMLGQDLSKQASPSAAHMISASRMTTGTDSQAGEQESGLSKVDSHKIVVGQNEYEVGGRGGVGGAEISDTGVQGKEAANEVEPTFQATG